MNLANPISFFPYLINSFIDCRVPDLSDADAVALVSNDTFSVMSNSPMTYHPQADPADKRAVWLIMEYVETDLGRYMKNPAKEWGKGGVPRGLPEDMVKVSLSWLDLS